MAKLNDADAIRLGASAVDRIYAGSNLIWPSASQGWFGTQLTNGGGNWGTNPDRAMLDRFTLTHTATLKRLFIYLLTANTANHNVKGLIYTDNAGAPGTLVAVGSPASTTGIVNAYLQSNFADEVIAPGDYWIGAVSNGFGREFGSGVHSAPSAVIINGDLSYTNPPTTCPAPAASYMNDVACYVEYTY